MKKRLYAKSYWRITGFCFILALAYSSAFARDRDEGRGRGHGREVVVVGHQRYNYHDGRFFRSGWFGLEIGIFSPPMGAVVSVIPVGCRTILYGGVTYYYYDNIYYTVCPTGYIVVPAPEITGSNIVVAQPQIQSNQTLVINVPNSNGSYTPVMLIKHNNGYIGPQGEYYEGNPTVEQLKALYGK